MKKIAKLQKEVSNLVHFTHVVSPSIDEFAERLERLEAGMANVLAELAAHDALFERFERLESDVVITRAEVARCEIDASYRMDAFDGTVEILRSGISHLARTVFPADTAKRDAEVAAILESICAEHPEYRASCDAWKAARAREEGKK